MKQELEKTNGNKIPQMSFNKDQIELLKRTVAKGTTDDELALFMHVCKKSGLDPFSRQIYAIKRWNSKEGKEVMTIQTGIDGYRLTAERTGNYCPGKEPSFNYDKDGKLISATAFIKKFVGGIWHEVSAMAFFDEYVSLDKQGNPTLFWQKMKHAMIAKVAEALALRKAFPSELSGVYTYEEMGQIEEPEKSTQTVAELKTPQLLDKPMGEIQESPAIISNVTQKTGITNKKEWKLYTIYTTDGTSLKTFSDTLAQKAKDMKDLPVLIQQSENKKGGMEIIDIIPNALVSNPSNE